MAASDAAMLGVAKVDMQKSHLAYLEELAQVEADAIAVVDQAQQWLGKVRSAITNQHKQHGADMAEVQACWLKCDKLAQQEGSCEKNAGLSKGVLVNTWDEEVAKMTAEEKVFAATYGAVLHICLAKGQEDKDKQGAPELNLTHAAPSGPATTIPSDTMKPAILKPVEAPPKNDRDVEAGEKPAKLPKKDGDTDKDAAMDDDLS